MAVGLTTIKNSYRHGALTEEWSNHYHLTGPDPDDAAAWKALVDAFIAEERKFLPDTTTIPRAYGYVSDADTATAVYSVDYRVAPLTPVNGVILSTDGVMTPSDAAMWIRWKLSRNNTKGRPVYLRKYYHGVMRTNGTSQALGDTPSPTQVTAYTNFATLLSSGAGVLTRKIRDTQGATIIGTGVSSWITTRTLKRRGKRP